MKTRHTLPALLLTLAGVAAPVIPFNTASAAPPAKVDLDISVGVKLPHSAVRIDVGGHPYYYHRGEFYRKGPRGYVVVRPPRGAVVRTLPPQHARVIIHGEVYYRVGDIFYRPAPDGFMVVEAPEVTISESAGTRPEATPASDTAVWLDGRAYILRNGQFFLRNSDGLVWHEPPFGAITKTIPDRAESIWYKDTEYFEVDGVFFRKTPDGYRLVAPPWTPDDTTAENEEPQG